MLTNVFIHLHTAQYCEELTHLKRPWCWERLRVREEGDRGWDDWMASPTQWTWVWVNSGSWWWTGRPGVLQSMGLPRVGHDWETEQNWTDIAQCSHHWDFKKSTLVTIADTVSLFRCPACVWRTPLNIGLLGRQSPQSSLAAAKVDTTIPGSLPAKAQT